MFRYFCDLWEIYICTEYIVIPICIISIFTSNFTNIILIICFIMLVILQNVSYYTRDMFVKDGYKCSDTFMGPCV